MDCAKSLWKKQPPVIIGIAGGSGAGKSWLANSLLRRLSKDACLISLDDFYIDRSHLSPTRRQRINFDHPRCIDWVCVESVLKDLLAGKPSSLPLYDFSTHSRRARQQSLSPKPLILFEGLWLFRRPSLRKLFSLRIFVECPKELRLQRRLERDQKERGRSYESICNQFQTCVDPMHERFVSPQARWADLVIDQPPTDEEVEQLAQRIATLIADKPL